MLDSSNDEEGANDGVTQLLIVTAFFGQAIRASLRL